MRKVFVFDMIMMEMEDARHLKFDEETAASGSSGHDVVLTGVA